MKNKITFLLLLGFSFLFSQQKTTGLVDLSTNVKATLNLDSGTSIATLTLTGPNDRWFALQFGSFSGGMEDGADLVYWNNVTLVDARHNGIGVTPTADVTNNWTVSSNTNNFPSAGLRTIVATRAFSTGDANDFTFNFADTTIDLAWARYSSASYTLDYHGAANRGVFLNVSFTLGSPSFSLSDSKVYPNPCNGDFTITTKTYLTKINVYSHTGVFIKTIEVSDFTENVLIKISGLQTGIYLLELQNETDKSWKKLIVN